MIDLQELVNGCMSDSLLLGAIADDFTGAADLASMLSESGVQTALCLGAESVPPTDGPNVQAVVVALKTRSIPASDACKQSLAALAALRRRGAQQIYFKYCSTFDSSKEGNIGPVTAALMKAMKVRCTVAVPALPVNGRTQYLGYLFVGDRLLSESHMREHPIHPMTDANLVRHLQTQMTGIVGLIPHERVRVGGAAIRRHIRELEEQGTSVALVDVLTDEDLIEIAQAVIDHRLVSGGSGLGWALAEIWRRNGLVKVREPETARALEAGPVLILSGSCSVVSLEQIAELRARFGEGIEIDIMRLVDDASSEVDRLHHRVRTMVEDRGWAFVFSSAAAEDRERTGSAAMGRGFSRETLHREIEASHRVVASRAIAEGLVRHLVVAGGETSGAVAEGLNLGTLEVVDVLDPGVPVLRPYSDIDGTGQRFSSGVSAELERLDLTVTFKSGNFGSPDFFSKALRRLGHIRRGSHDE